ncbi:NAD-dependent epimerase/dehydratase family protein [Parasedimentitalea maritima]|uniref:NAD-dependent epimerase/dehydratase family protein n=1 Tax=Parasedimentitalea maritima TaxID=2578117 RepID=A0A6A4RIU4_9RHOB|nr:NAD-dependent epimerase/dehydratase family protein [Zongyanglinia marina]KAE9629351.1 NAD-dependent epimerase/dehydratase family protein [Zongyanglinia marina]
MLDQKLSPPRTALVTGSAGFIGYHLSARLLADGWRVIGLDCLSPYYDVTLKECRHAVLQENAEFIPVIGKLEDPGLLMQLFAEHQPDAVVHLAAQAGVRHSIDAPRDYVESNLVGTFELLEAGRAHPPAHMLLASTSSVYGANTEMPFNERMQVETQMSFYAATKKATESMAHSYAHLYQLPTTMFRFFTVYGPWGRPDMALFKFTRAMLAGEAIDVYNHGRMSRDFTYIDDLIAGIFGLIEAVPGDTPVSDRDSLSPVAPFRSVNIGANAPTPLMDYISAIETAIGVEARKNMLDMQAGDVPATWADAGLLQDLTGVCAKVDVVTGVRNFVEWYRDYYKV